MKVRLSKHAMLSAEAQCPCRRLTKRALLACGVATAVFSTASIGLLSLLPIERPLLFGIGAILLRALQGVAAAAVDVSSFGIVTQ